MKGPRMHRNIISTNDLRVSFQTEEGVVRAVNGVWRSRKTRPLEGHAVACHSAEELDLSGVEYANFLERLKLLWWCQPPSRLHT